MYSKDMLGIMHRIIQDVKHMLGISAGRPAGNLPRPEPPRQARRRGGDRIRAGPAAATLIRIMNPGFRGARTHWKPGFMRD
jgi:hypothetical protein